MYKLLYLVLVFTAISAQASDLDLEIDSSLAAVTTTNTSAVFAPPLLDSTYKFLAFTAQESPYPNAISNSTVAILSSRAHMTCVILGYARAVSVSYANIADPSGDDLALVVDDVAYVDKFIPVIKFGKLVPPAYISNLKCN